MHINRQAMVAHQPIAESILSSHLVCHKLGSRMTPYITTFKSLLEEQLLDSRGWLSDTELPSSVATAIADVFRQNGINVGRKFANSQSGSIS